MRPRVRGVSRLIMQYLEENPGFTTRQIEDGLNIKRGLTRTYISRLRGHGLITSDGSAEKRHTAIENWASYIAGRKRPEQKPVLIQKSIADHWIDRLSGHVGNPFAGLM